MKHFLTPTHIQLISPSLESENLSSDRSTTEGLVCTRWTQCPGKTVQAGGWHRVHMVQPSPGLSLSQDFMSVSCACLCAHLLPRLPSAESCCKRLAEQIEMIQKLFYEVIPLRANLGKPTATCISEQPPPKVGGEVLTC